MMSDDEDNEQQRGTLLPFLSQSSKKPVKKRKSDDMSASQPPSKSRRHTDLELSDGSHRVLLQVLEKVLSLETEVKDMKTSVNELKDEYLNKDVSINQEIRLEKMSKDIEAIKEKLEGVPQTDVVQASGSVDTESTSVEEVPAPDIPASVPVKPSEVIPDWEKYLKKRKFGYNKYINNNGRYEIQMKWKNLDTPFIPAEYLPKEMVFGESEREYEVRKKRKRQDHDAYIELLAIRRDEGLAEAQSVDTLVEDLINELDAEASVKDSFKAVYHRSIKDEEQASIKRWEKTEKGILETPERETGKKIVVSNDRVYSKAIKKGLKKAKVNQPRGVTTTTKIQEPWKVVNRRQHYSVPQPEPQPHYYNYQQPILFPDLRQPPPSLYPTYVRQPGNASSFHWGTPTSRWKLISPDVRI